MAEDVRPRGGCRFPMLKANTALEDIDKAHSIQGHVSDFEYIEESPATEDTDKAHSIKEHSEKFELEFSKGVYPTEDLTHDEEIFIEGVDGATKIETALSLFTDIIRRINAGEVNEIVATATDVNGNKLTWTI